jgi:hypothetical protein
VEYTRKSRFGDAPLSSPTTIPRNISTISNRRDSRKRQTQEFA